MLIRDHILDSPRCAIWASMGTGKTSATLSALDILMLHDDSPVLIIAPLRVALSTWPDEVAKWSNFAHLTVSPIVGGGSKRLAGVNKPAQIYTVNFENIAWLVEHIQRMEKIFYPKMPSLRSALQKFQGIAV